jgi:hypothetical protein
LKPSQLFAEDTEDKDHCSNPAIKQMISKGDVCDAKNIAGLLYYLEYRKNPKVLS